MGRPSIVTILRPAHVDAGVTQDFTATPSTCTVQTPHWAIPQPNLVPVRLRTSRITQSRGISGSARSTVCFLPLIVREIWGKVLGVGCWVLGPKYPTPDRKSTRLNSSHRT